MKSSTIVGKVKKKATRIFAKYLPFNLKYRPIGVQKLFANDASSISYTELAKPYISVLNLRPKFIEDCSPFIKPIVSVEFPVDYFAVLKNARVYSHDPANVAFISEENYLIEEPSFQWRNDVIAPGKENIIFTLKGFLKPKKYQGTVFSLLATGAPKYYYYHWMHDLLPKLEHLKQSGYFDRVDYFLIPNYEFRFQRESLDFFGITKDKIINEETNPHIQVDNLIVSSYVRMEDHHPKWACDFLYNSFTRSLSGLKQDKLIYIARGDAAKNRKVLNEADVIKALKEFGFEAYYLTGLSFVDQAKLFNSAKVVVGAHGGGLSNLVFCASGTKVLEIYPDQYVRHLFYDLSNKRDLDYDYMLSPADGTCVGHADGQSLGLTVNIEFMKVKVGSLLAN